MVDGRRWIDQRHPILPERLQHLSAMVCQTHLEAFNISLKLLDFALVCFLAFAPRSLLLADLCLQRADCLSLLLDDAAVLVHQVLVLCIPVHIAREDL